MRPDVFLRSSQGLEVGWRLPRHLQRAQGQLRPPLADRQGPHEGYETKFQRDTSSGRPPARITGQLKHEGILTHLFADQIEDLSHRLSDLGHPMVDAVGRHAPRLTTPRAHRASPPTPYPRANRPSGCSPAEISIERATNSDLELSIAIPAMVRSRRTC